MLEILKNNGEEDLKQFVEALRNRLQETLPGKDAHIKMASRVRLNEFIFNDNSSNAILSSVLILLYRDSDVIKTVFILRQSYDGIHSGQVSFPGGRKEDTDDSLIDTALREANEEVNIDPEQVDVLGTLSEIYIPPSNYLVLPVIGYKDSSPEFIPEKSEVAEIIDADISFLFDKNLVKETLLDVRGYKIQAPYFDVKGHTVWGATAMILNELKEVIESIG